MHGSHDDHQHHGQGHGVGHNGAPAKAAQWQTPHIHEDHHEHDHPPVSDEFRDLDLVEKAFCEGFAAASDPTSFLRLAGVPFSATDADGKTLHLLRVEHSAATDVGNITPHLGGGSFRYAPLPARLTSRRNDLGFVYFNGSEAIRLSYGAMKKLAATPSEI
jgi:hypothetical protein